MSWRLVLRFRIAVLLFSIAVALAADTQPIGRRRALLIGINDYTASKLGQPQSVPPERRDWPNLSGAVNDVSTLREMLIERYAFEPRDVVVLTDQAATRAAILAAIDRHLLKPAAEGDVLFFYFAGHGSQVRNSLSEEPDRLDESFVPADSRLGVEDIRDKELRRMFNRILDRGAHLSVILDACHSGSGIRGGGKRSSIRYRGVRRDDRDIADATSAGPRPEDHGALVFSAAQDYDRAWERRDENGRMHGAFSWAWIRALRDASATEPAEETFLRAQARLRGETPFQEPVMAGTAEARRNPFLRVSTGTTLAARAVVAVERIRSDGTVLLQGGWANGLSVGSQLRAANDRLTVTAVTGPARSEARIDAGTVSSGELVEVDGGNDRPWQIVEASDSAQATYHLDLRPTPGCDDTVDLVLRAPSPLPSALPPRHYYAFMDNGAGRSVLVYPRSGSVENRFPLEQALPEIPLATIDLPVRTLFLLTTDEPLPNPWVLERPMQDELPEVASTTWSLEKTVEKTPQRVAGSV